MLSFYASLPVNPECKKKETFLMQNDCQILKISLKKRNKKCIVENEIKNFNRNKSLTVTHNDSFYVIPVSICFNEEICAAVCWQPFLAIITFLCVIKTMSTEPETKRTMRLIAYQRSKRWEGKPSGAWHQAT